MKNFNNPKQLEKLVELQEDTVVRIKDITYGIANRSPEVGDMLLDRRDGLYGICEMFNGKNYVAMRDGCFVDIAVPIDKIYVLKIIPNPFFKN